MAWTTPTQITPATKISDTDDIINAIMLDLHAYVDGTVPYTGVGLTSSLVTLGTTQEITSPKVFSSQITANGGMVGNVTGNVIGDVTGNADTSTTATNSLALNGEVVSDTVTSASTTAPAAQNSVKTAYDLAASKVSPTDYATATTGGVVKISVVGNVLNITTS